MMTVTSSQGKPSAAGLVIPSTPISKVLAPYTQNKPTVSTASANQKTIASNTPNKYTPRTPTGKTGSSYIHNQSTKSAGSARLVPTFSRISLPVTPTKFLQSSIQRQQNLVFGSPVPNPFATQTVGSKASTKSAISSISHMSPSKSQKNAGSATGSPNRTIQELSAGLRAAQNSPSRRAPRTPLTERDRHRDSSSRTTPATLDKRNFSDKVDMLYRAKSLEKWQASVRNPNNTCQEATISGSSATIGITPSKNRISVANTMVVPAEVIETKRSIVADMRRLFDGRRSNKSSSITKITRLPAGHKATPRKRLSPKIAAPSVRSSPPAILLHYDRSLVIPLKAVPKVIAIKSQNPSQWVAASTTSNLPSFVPKRSTLPKSKKISEKIKLFERTSRDENAATLPSFGKKRESITRKINRSLKSFFEPPATRKSEDVKEIEGAKRKSLTRGTLINKQIQDIVDEIPDQESLSPVTNEAKLGIGPRKALAVGIDGTRSTESENEKVLGRPNSEDTDEMIVKEAKCGLRQPKPLRVVEMKRMMALCRDRISGGSIRHREKGVESVLETKI